MGSIPLPTPHSRRVKTRHAISETKARRRPPKGGEQPVRLSTPACSDIRSTYRCHHHRALATSTSMHGSNHIAISCWGRGIKSWMCCVKQTWMCTGSIPPCSSFTLAADSRGIENEVWTANDPTFIVSARCRRFSSQAQAHGSIGQLEDTYQHYGSKRSDFSPISPQLWALCSHALCALPKPAHPELNTEAIATSRCVSTTAWAMTDVPNAVGSRGVLA